jgi:hypothetical protein
MRNGRIVYGIPVCPDEATTNATMHKDAEMIAKCEPNDIAQDRKLLNSGSIFIVNMFLGWTERLHGRWLEQPILHLRVGMARHERREWQPREGSSFRPPTANPQHCGKLATRGGVVRLGVGWRLRQIQHLGHRDAHNLMEADNVACGLCRV